MNRYRITWSDGLVNEVSTSWQPYMQFGWPRCYGKDQPKVAYPVVIERLNQEQPFTP